jgi:hypothetical protein
MVAKSLIHSSSTVLPIKLTIELSLQNLCVLPPGRRPYRTEAVLSVVQFLASFAAL